MKNHEEKTEYFFLNIKYCMWMQSAFDQEQSPNEREKNVEILQLHCGGHAKKINWSNKMKHWE